MLMHAEPKPQLQQQLQSQQQVGVLTDIWLRTAGLKSAAQEQLPAWHKYMIAPTAFGNKFSEGSRSTS